jgi:hypothetical protein
MSVSIVSFKITGLSPLLMNNPLSMGGGGGGLKTKKIPSPKDESDAKVYRDEEGNLYLPALMFRSALLGACAGRRLGKVGAKGVIAGSVFNTDVNTTLMDPDTGKPIREWKINVMRAVVQGNGVQRARPEIPKWSCNIDLEVDHDFIPDAQLVCDLLNIAGKVRGVGDFRPQKMGPYGRFSAERVENTIKAKGKNK